MKDAKLQTSLMQETQAELDASGYISILIDASYFSSSSEESYRVKFNGRGTKSAILRINGYTDKTWPHYAECPFNVSDSWKAVRCAFTKPVDGHGVQISIFPGDGETLHFREKDFKIVLIKSDGSESMVAYRQSSSSGEAPKSVYHFLFDNMVRSIKAFRRNNPTVQIVVSSLVSRWPMDTEDQFGDQSAHVWWMPEHRVGRQDAALLVESLNTELEQFAISHGLVFVDMAKVFSTLDRQRLMIDFCHMTKDGYKIMAGTFYKELQNQNIVRGTENTEYDHLLQEYTINDQHNFLTN